MRAYFTASIVGKKDYLDEYTHILTILEENGIEIIENIIHNNAKRIENETVDQRIEIQKKLEKNILEADFVVVEASFPSISVGYEISLSLHRGKPTLVLYTSDHHPSLIANSDEDKLVCEQYTKQTVDSIIEDSIKYVESINESRFTFYISSELAAHLDKSAKKTCVPKAVYLRSLIKEDMEKKI